MQKNSHKLYLLFGIYGLFFTTWSYVVFTNNFNYFSKDSWNDTKIVRNKKHKTLICLSLISILSNLSSIIIGTITKYNDKVLYVPLCIIFSTLAACSAGCVSGIYMHLFSQDFKHDKNQIHFWFSWFGLICLIIQFVLSIRMRKSEHDYGEYEFRNKKFSL